MNFWRHQNRSKQDRQIVEESVERPLLVHSTKPLVFIGMSASAASKQIGSKQALVAASLRSAHCMLPAEHCSNSLSFIAWGRYRIHTRRRWTLSELLVLPKDIKRLRDETKRCETNRAGSVRWFVSIKQQQQQQQQKVLALPERIQPVDHGSKASKKFFLFLFLSLLSFFNMNLRLEFTL